MERFDLAVIGAGAAGMFCAGVAGQRGLKVLLLDHAPVIGEKIRISGGGRCNFTNVNGADHERYVSADPRFARHVLRAYPPGRFVDLVRRYRIDFHEKHLGQLFCNDASRQIIDLLKAECGAGRVTLRHPVRVLELEGHAGEGQRFTVLTDHGRIGVRNLVIATGGLSIPALGATAFAWEQAAKWSLTVVPARPGLVPLTFPAARWQPFAGLAGVSLPVAISAPDDLASRSGMSGARNSPAASRRRQGVSFHED
ncbi:MAG TPA: NAD(P)/FAD-dependent oxidoreductase, partial [Lautropia sp.]|nr:NAD(P)/FAD-dependent oxidoreductase [Lautropia sp.]